MCWYLIGGRHGSITLASESRWPAAMLNAAHHARWVRYRQPRLGEPLRKPASAQCSGNIHHQKLKLVALKLVGGTHEYLPVLHFCELQEEHV